MQTESVYKEAFKVTCIIYLLGLIEFIIFSLIMEFRFDIFLGTLYGCTFSSANFFYLAHSVKKCVDRDEKSAKVYMSATYSKRMLLTAVMIIVAVKVKQLYLWASIIPLVFTRIAVYIVSFLNSRAKKKEVKKLGCKRTKNII